jgi:hypothetical protein
LDDGRELVLIERRKVIDTTDMHTKVFREKAEGLKPFFFTPDDDEVEMISDRLS